MCASPKTMWVCFCWTPGPPRTGSRCRLVHVNILLKYDVHTNNTQILPEQLLWLGGRRRSEPQHPPLLLTDTSPIQGHYCPECRVVLPVFCGWNHRHTLFSCLASNSALAREMGPRGYIHARPCTVAHGVSLLWLLSM